LQQQFPNPNLLVAADWNLSLKSGNFRRDKNHICSDISISGAGEEVLDGYISADQGACAYDHLDRITYVKNTSRHLISPLT